MIPITDEQLWGGQNPRDHYYEGPTFARVEAGEEDRCAVCQRKHDSHPPDGYGIENREGDPAFSGAFDRW